jgi:hypothetical protein
MVMIVSNVRCLFRIASNIGRRKVDATGRIFNEKELGGVWRSRFGRVRLRPNRGFPGYPAPDVTPEKITRLLPKAA